MSGWIDYFQASFSILSSDSSSSVGCNSNSSSSSRSSRSSSSRRTSRSTQVEPTISCNNDVSIDISGDDSGSDKYNNRYTFDENILDNYDIIYSTFNSSECIQSLLNDVIYDLFLTNNNKESNLLNDGYNYNTCNNGDIYFTIAGKNDDNYDNYDDSRKNSCGSSSSSSSSSSYIHSKTSPYIAAPATTKTDLLLHHQHNHHDGGLLCKHTWSTYSIKRKLVSLIKLLVSQLCVPPIMAIYGIGRQLNRFYGLIDRYD